MSISGSGSPYPLNLSRIALNPSGKYLKVKRITPKICHYKPVLKDTRVLVADVLDILANGITIEEVLEEYT